MRAENLLWNVAALVAAGAAYAIWLRPRHLRWGATDKEAREELPGDERTPHVRSQATHAITIHAPVSEVWQWLVQIGQDKGGFYSYAWLENLVGCHMRNVDRIVPEFQHIQVGDSVWLHPKAPPLPVLQVESERTIVLGSNTREPGTWSFHLKPIGDASKRLVIRGRGEWKPTLVRELINDLVFEPAHFVMERKMMLTIKYLAEREVQSHHQTDSPATNALS